MKQTLPFLLLIVLSLPLISFSQDVATEAADSVEPGPWKQDFKFAFGLNQASFSDNWTGGGINSVGLQTMLNYKPRYKKGKWSWDSEIDLLYGMVNNDGQGYRKTQDRIFIDTKAGYEINKDWDGFASLNFLSQFAEGFRYDKDSLDREVEVKISDFMAPAYITFALGFEYKPVDYFFVRLSPYAPRLTVVNDTTLYRAVPENYGVEIGETTEFEMAAFQLLADFDKALTDNLRLKARYLMYANYEKSLEEIDHRVDALLSVRIAKYLDFGLTGILVYDKDQIDELQWNQGLTFNFIYTFKNYKEE